jgi:hypothetical protein
MRATIPLFLMVTSSERLEGYNLELSSHTNLHTRLPAVPRSA